MTTKDKASDADDARPVGRRKPRSKVLPKDYNWLSVPVPSAVHNHVHIQARQSNMSLKDYLAWFLTEARPYEEMDSSDGVPF
jgi:hypothetical protein